MKRGKRICNTLKEVRMQVAKANDIKYAPTECHHEGDCAGTCPKCESEVRWLEQQLQLRRQLGKAVAVVGVSMGLAAITACDGKLPYRTAGEVDVIPDTLSEVNTAADPCATDTNTVPDTLLTIRQAAGTDSIEIEGKIERGMPEPIYTSSYPGGKQALLNFLNENTKYPEQAVKDNIEGMVVVRFEVASDGNIHNPHIFLGVHPLLDAEALRVVNLMPKWNAGDQGTFNLPISFKLDKHHSPTLKFEI
ncbi:MAG: energy transducer TonB [Prevotella sp.]|nr:energy transducer TonB [Prevotella sp.]